MQKTKKRAIVLAAAIAFSAGSVYVQDRIAAHHSQMLRVEMTAPATQTVPAQNHEAAAADTRKTERTSFAGLARLSDAEKGLYWLGIGATGILGLIVAKAGKDFFGFRLVKPGGWKLFGRRFGEKDPSYEGPALKVGQKSIQFNGFVWEAGKVLYRFGKWVSVGAWKKSDPEND